MEGCLSVRLDLPGTTDNPRGAHTPIRSRALRHKPCQSRDQNTDLALWHSVTSSFPRFTGCWACSGPELCGETPPCPPGAPSTSRGPSSGHSACLRATASVLNGKGPQGVSVAELTPLTCKQLPPGNGQGLGALTGGPDPTASHLPPSYPSPIGRSPPPGFGQNKTQHSFPPSLDDHVRFLCPGWHLHHHQGCPSWAGRGQVSQLGNVHVVAT